jgi:hypothetical protein
MVWFEGEGTGNWCYFIRYAPVLSNDPLTTQTVHAFLKKYHPFRLKKKDSPAHDFNELLRIYYVKRKLKYIDFMFESDIHVNELQLDYRPAYLTH